MRLKPLANERPPRAHAEGASRRGGVVKRGERHGFGFFGLNSAPLLPWCVILGDVCSFGAPSPRLPRTDDNTSPSQASGGKGETGGGPQHRDPLPRISQGRKTFENFSHSASDRVTLISF